MVYFIHSYKRSEFYYYKNLGASKVLLWVSTLSFDFMMFLLVLILSLKMR